MRYLFKNWKQTIESMRVNFKWISTDGKKAYMNYGIYIMYKLEIKLFQKQYK